MAFVNLLHRAHTIILIIAAIANLCSTEDVAPTHYRSCDAYLFPSGNPNEFVCNSGAVDYHCVDTSCGEYTLTWDKFTFTDCLAYVNYGKSRALTTNNKAIVSPFQYHVSAYYTDVQDRDDKNWYRCPFSLENSFNSRRATCTDCK
ncbi:hypothetical protein PTTG_25531 [Puccinia triticina 1-1 BBBD Race 1]|uniref:Chitin-binding type-2 domain-containing protein n=2 Tax=Puccinia triticina TaxID=208348 RepID=A0A180H221_PUCT1|nr:uncharacterized protein PtA15_5A667 [Puccinia triticina]OAV98841.1 hypothetical protein PTTG_25531 [Puccinia triticina 1-1 BBBD Race 1]WAQ85093.1 hypothetical protein PtA15_5A667 [Puccinia triticina]WAR58426.1 hypothetical protein PtB15_5B660 [Puccinia triticina]